MLGTLALLLSLSLAQPVPDLRQPSPHLGGLTAGSVVAGHPASVPVRTAQMRFHGRYGSGSAWGLQGHGSWRSGGDRGWRGNGPDYGDLGRFRGLPHRQPRRNGFHGGAWDGSRGGWHHRDLHDRHRHHDMHGGTGHWNGRDRRDDRGRGGDRGGDRNVGHGGWSHGDRGWHGRADRAPEWKAFRDRERAFERRRERFRSRDDLGR